MQPNHQVADKPDSHSSDNKSEVSKGSQLPMQQNKPLYDLLHKVQGFKGNPARTLSADIMGGANKQPFQIIQNNRADLQAQIQYVQVQTERNSKGQEQIKKVCHQHKDVIDDNIHNI